jgi:hypothetical protein
MLTRSRLRLLVAFAFTLGTGFAHATSVSVYGAWLCSNDSCTWGKVRDLAEFDRKNHWLIDRGDGRPSVNLVVLSFINPLKLLNRTNDAATENGIPRGITPEIVNYFKSKGIRVMLSIGGITYTKDWNTALATDASKLGLNAAATAQSLGVGIEIDYEEDSSPNLAGLQDFVAAYRSQLRFDASGNNHAARLTIDLAAGDSWLIDITRKASSDWLGATPVLDYANAMVPDQQPDSAQDAISNWQEHVDGKPAFSPPIPPLAPARFTGSLYIVTGNSPAPECANFRQSLTATTGSFVQSVRPKIGKSPGMLGYMFWAAECPSRSNICTIPPNSCEKGVGAGASNYNVPEPMPALRRY